jgi:phage terminase small subunit
VTEKQKRFVAEYLKDCNGKEAAIRAGYAAGSAKQRACELLQKSGVAAEIEAYRARVREESILSHEKSCEILSQIAEGAEKESDRIRAIEALAKLRGYNSADEVDGKMEVTYRFVMGAHGDGGKKDNCNS